MSKQSGTQRGGRSEAGDLQPSVTPAAERGEAAGGDPASSPVSDGDAEQVKGGSITFQRPTGNSA